MTWDRTDPLENAIWLICDELQVEDWTIRDDHKRGIPEPDDWFPSVLRQRLSPLFGKWKEHRIAALRAEIERLETDG